ncbi:MAG: DUF3375 domain-containing protein, partial [Gammaproteobacteria bacterium]|nr:DUF3375 domain-containing protein [Gammaproteobacteria bacterium]
MEYEYVLKLKQTHPTLRLLAAENAPLIIGFLFQQFVTANRRSVGYSDLVSRLEDYLYHLRERYGEDKYPKGAKQYLDDWADERSPFLRKYYTERSDEPEFDLTPATEKAIEWIRDLQAREFVGTESRLLTVFQLLREIVHESERDPKTRIDELERRKAAIEDEIDRVRAGRMEPLDPTQVRERFFQAEDTARKLLADFRQVEYNFRRLDRVTREHIATGDRPKGEMLDEIFTGHDEIRDSDQGRSFRAFWEFLMSPKRQAELDELLEAVYGLEPVRELEPGALLGRIKYFLLEAGEKVYGTNSRLVEQLRKYLDDQAWLENKRIMDLIRGIERHGVAIKDTPPNARMFTGVDELRPGIELIMARGLFVPPRNPVIEAIDLTEGKARVDVGALFSQTYIDEQALAANVRRLLQSESQVSLVRVLEHYPVTKGLAEVIGYLNLAARDEKALIDEEHREHLEIDATNGKSKLVWL